jgi:hypothetical protein
VELNRKIAEDAKKGPSKANNEKNRKTKKLVPHPKTNQR